MTKTEWIFEPTRDRYYFWFGNWPICRIKPMTSVSWQVTGRDFEMIVHGSNIEDIKYEATLILRDFGFEIPFSNLENALK